MIRNLLGFEVLVGAKVLLDDLLLLLNQHDDGRPDPLIEDPAACLQFE